MSENLQLHDWHMVNRIIQYLFFKDGKTNKDSKSG